MPTINKNKSKFRKKTYSHYNQSSKYYNSKQWKHLRYTYIKSNPLCEECLRQNKVRPAEHVHHIRPFLTGITDNEQWSLLLDEHNLMSVCVECHYKLHNGGIRSEES